MDACPRNSTRLLRALYATLARQLRFGAAYAMVITWPWGFQRHGLPGHPPHASPCLVVPHLLPPPAQGYLRAPPLCREPSLAARRG